jgi:hypothetical protein
VSLNDLANLLKSEEYRCPGSHWSRRLTQDEEELSHENQLPDGVTWVGMSECGQTISIFLEYEGGEFGSRGYSYPVAEGSCVEALGLDEEGLYESFVFGRYVERQFLRKAFENAGIPEGRKKITNG